MSALPFISIQVNGIPLKALVDTGCEKSVLLERCCKIVKCVPKGPATIISMLNDQKTVGKGVVVVNVEVETAVVDLECLVVGELVQGAQMILGMDAIIQLGGVRVGREVQFGQDSSEFQVCAAEVLGRLEGDHALEIEEKDFHAQFDGSRWIVKWKWAKEEPCLRNQLPEYPVAEEDKEEYESEVIKWIDEGWLVEYDEEKHGVVNGLIPLMAAKQPNKPKKVRPVMDYRELNRWVKSNPGVEPAICQEKLRRWRSDGTNACLLDLRKAYLQVHIDESLHRYQVVKFQGKAYVMTRMGFGLCVAPKIMSRILDKVLSLEHDVADGTDHYIDDIWVNTDRVAVEKVRTHLQKYGLEAKDPEPIENARVLGLRVSGSDGGVYRWQRDGAIPEVGKVVMRRELFSICGKLVGHYPVAGWLRTACSYVRRLTNKTGWDERVCPKAEMIVREIVRRVNEQDPVKGEWAVRKEGGCTVWCDASSLAIGVCLEVNGKVIEDGAWLRKEDDGAHINVAELEAVMKGVTLALKWGFTSLKIVTDSATVGGWVKSVLEDTKRPRVTGMCEMIVRRRLGIIGQLREEYSLEMTIELVASANNKADSLTRVPQRWLQSSAAAAAAYGNSSTDDDVRAVHNQHHFGVQRTLYLAEKVLGRSIELESVEKVVRSCHRCRSVDPQPVTWSHGCLGVEVVWERLATDITFVNGHPYLSVVDCGPSRFAIWHRISRETGDTVASHLNSIFLERGPPKQLLSDQGPCFVSSRMKRLLADWGVEQLFSGAYQHSGNGIVERNHRTIKRTAARSGTSVEEAVYWYNHSPMKNGAVPAMLVYKYHADMRGRRLASTEKTSHPKFSVGDTVYVKPANLRCTTAWKTGTITRLISDQTVEVDGTNRHVADLRFAWSGDDGEGYAGEDGGEVDTTQSTTQTGIEMEWNSTDSNYDESADELSSDDTAEVNAGNNVRRSTRERHLPDRYGLYYTH